MSKSLQISKFNSGTRGYKPEVKHLIIMQTCIRCIVYPPFMNKSSLKRLAFFSTNIRNTPASAHDVALFLIVLNLFRLQADLTTTRDSLALFDVRRHCGALTRQKELAIAANRTTYTHMFYLERVLHNTRSCKYINIKIYQTK